MQRTANVHLELETFGRTNMVFSMTPAIGANIASELLEFRLDGAIQHAAETVDVHGTRLHTFLTEKGLLAVDYSLEIGGEAAVDPIDERDLITYLRPSRYAQSDTLTPFARSEFAGLTGYTLIQAITNWVFESLTYASGSSRPTDSATETLASRRGVCRDFAHATIALLRAMEIPARMVAVYAPGLSPMDFHAVTEAFVDGAWWVIDSSRLAPRQSLVRLSTGRDAADTAWLTSTLTDLSFRSMTLTVTTPSLPLDNHTDRVQLR